jgi:hypothetical protein
LLNSTKSVLGAREVTFGYTGSAGATWPLEENDRFQQPILVRDFRHFLGKLKFCRQFVPQTARIQAALYAALAGGPKVKGPQPLDWTCTMVEAFDDCKIVLSRAEPLAHPDLSAPLAVFTNASSMAALQQHVCDAWQPLAFYYHKPRPAQQKYSP